MKIHKTTRGDFKFQFHCVNEAIESLVQGLKENADITLANTFSLPAVTNEMANERHLAQTKQRLKFNDEESDLILNKPFDVVHLQNELAIKSAIDHLRKVRATGSESTRYSTKLPGLINIETEDVSATYLTSLFENLNNERCKLKDVIHRLSTSVDERFEIVHDIEPGLIFPMATRTLKSYVMKDIISCRFSWEHKSFVKVLSRADVIEKINRSLIYGSNGVDGFSLHVQEELKVISHFSENTKFNIIRQTPAAPILKIRFNEPKNMNNKGTELTLRKDIHAHSPVFLINCIGQQKFKPLGNYKGRPDNKIKADPIIPRLHLYLKS